MQKSKKILLSFMLAVGTTFAGSNAFACAGNGETFTLKEGVSDCIQVGQGHKVVHCIVSNLNQNANLLITHSGFYPNSNYSAPRWALHINHNMQRITFSGVGTSDGSSIHFHYYGPWDPMGYEYNLTCRW